MTGTKQTRKKDTTNIIEKLKLNFSKYNIQDMLFNGI